MNTTQNKDDRYVDEDLYALVLVIESAVDVEQLRMIRDLLLATEASSPAEPGVTTGLWGCVWCGCMSDVGDIHCPRSLDGLHHFYPDVPF